MLLLLPIHIVAGLCVLVSGAVALFTRKGARLHRRSGLIFVYAMVALTASAAVMAVLKSQTLNVVAASLAFYLVTTALLAVRHPGGKPGVFDVGAMLFGLALGVAGVGVGVAALSGGVSRIDGAPPGLVIFFGALALLATLGDVRMLLARGLREPQRIARHLWRMGFALWMATTSFFLGQADLLPPPLRIMPLLALPGLLVLLLMFYWLARVLFTQWRPRA